MRYIRGAVHLCLLLSLACPDDVLHQTRGSHAGLLMPRRLQHLGRVLGVLLVRTVRQPALLVEQSKQALRLAEQHAKRGCVVWRVRVMIRV